MTRAEQAAASRLIDIAGYQVRLPAGYVKIDGNAVSYDLAPLYEALKPMMAASTPG